MALELKDNNWCRGFYFKLTPFLSCYGKQLQWSPKARGHSEKALRIIYSFIGSLSTLLDARHVLGISYKL